MSANNRIALVTVWFGTWKGWINLHLETCARNPEVVWFFLHDQPDLPANRPANVRFVHVTLADLAARCSAVLGRPIVLTNAYKACDLKPLLGAMYAELLTDFGWWGYCDSDLLWGNIRHFITDEDLASHDIITSHVCTIVGQFTILRSTDLAVRLVKEIPDVDVLLDAPLYRGIDELLIDAAATRHEKQGELRVSRRMLQVWERLYTADWENWASRRETARLGRPVEVHFPCGPCEWKDGRVIHLSTGNETMFFHFLEWKRGWKMPLYPWPMSDLESIRMEPAGFRFKFRQKNFTRNLMLRLRHEMPHRIAAPIRFYSAKAGRGWRKLQSRLRPAA